MSQPTTPTPLPPLSNREVRELKGRAQRLNAVTKLGKGGMSDEFISGVDRELTLHGLIKVKLTELKEQRFEVAEQIAARTHAYLIGVIGHVVVLYRPRPEGFAAPAPTAPARPAKSSVTARKTPTPGLNPAAGKPRPGFRPTGPTTKGDRSDG